MELCRWPWHTGDVRMETWVSKNYRRRSRCKIWRCSQMRILFQSGCVKGLLDVWWHWNRRPSHSYHRLRSSPTTQHAKQPNRPVVCLRSWGFQAHVWGAGIAVVANDCGPWLSPPPQGGNRLGRQFQLAEFHNKELQTILAVVGSLLCCVGP